MNTVINSIIENAHLLVNNQQFEPINKYNDHLINVQHLCLHNPKVMGMIPAEDAGDVGIAFYHLLDLTGEEYISVYPTYSSISFYFLQKAIYQDSKKITFNEHDKFITTMIKLMNIGARPFSRTIARAYGKEPSDFVNYGDWQNLPPYVKMVLLIEYSYFKDMMKYLKGSNSLFDIFIEVSQEARLRYNFLVDCARNGYFDNIFNEGQLDNWQIIQKAETVKKKVFNYVSSKIEVGDFIFK